MILKSNSKVNLGLKILNQRPDGMHNIITLYKEIDFGDIIQIKKKKEGCSIQSNVEWIPMDKSNLCYQAYDLLSKEVNKDLGVVINIDKKIPTGSGIGGGSANAATMLKGLNSLYSLRLKKNILEKNKNLHPL